MEREVRGSDTAAPAQTNANVTENIKSPCQSKITWTFSNTLALLCGMKSEGLPVMQGQWLGLGQNIRDLSQ